MTDVPLGFSFDEDDNGFILRNKTADGVVIAIKMKPEELHSLKGTIDLWSDRRMSTFQAATGSVQAIVAYAVARVRLLSDAVQDNVLLTVEGPSGEQETLSFPLVVAAGG